MREPTSRATGLTLAAAALLNAAGVAPGQVRDPRDDGPIIVGEQVGRYNWWDLQSASLELELFGEFRKDSTSTPGQPKQVLRDERIRGTTNLAFESYIGHKNLIDLTGLVKLGYEDQTITTSFPETRVNQSPFTYLYDLRALVLANSPTPITVYSTRDETVTAREFLGSLRTQTTEHGVSVNIESEKIPTRLQYFHRDQSQNDPLGTQDFTAVQDTFALQTQTRLSDDQRLEFAYTYDHIDEDQGSFFSDTYDRHDGTLTHYWYFGSESRSNLRSNLRFFERSGRFDQSLLRLDEQMVLYLTDRLENRYNLTFEEQTRGGAEQRIISGNAQLRHRLFESLVSTATAGGSAFEIPGEFDSTELFTSGALDYTKRVPYGRFTAAAGLGFNHQDNSERGTSIFVLNESRRFTDPLDVVISRRNIIPSSIRITDVTQFQTYVENIDYRVEASAAEVRIRRVATGAILNGQSVLISYQIGPEPESQIDTLTSSISVRYSIDEGFLKGLSLYSILQKADHSISATDPTQFVLDDFTDIRYGAEYRIGDYWFLAEMQDRESTVSPFERLRLEAHFDRRVGRTSVISAEAAYEKIEYKRPSNNVDFYRLQGRWIERLGAGLELNLYLQYRDERNERNGNVRGFEQGVELNWRYRQTRLYGGFRNSMLQGDASDQTSQTFTIGLVRTF